MLFDGTPIAVTFIHAVVLLILPWKFQVLLFIYIFIGNAEKNKDLYVIFYLMINSSILPFLLFSLRKFKLCSIRI